MDTQLATTDTQVVLSRREVARFEPNEEQRRMIRATYANGASDAEFQVLMEIARARNLNPLLRQIHFVKRWTPSGDVWAPQVSIDGLRAIAERTGLYAGQDEPEFVENPDGSLKLCKVAVWRKDWTRPVYGVAYWVEYVQTTRDRATGKERPAAMWAKMPHVMLAKVAESIALRKAFPEDAGGLYTDDEMGQADNGRHEHEEEARVSRSKARPSLPPSNTLSESARQASDHEEGPSVPPALAAFYAGLPGLAGPSAGALLWHEHRAALNAAEGRDRPEAWDALVKRVVRFGGGVASVTAAKNFLKSELAALSPKPAPAVEPQPVAVPVEAPAPEVAPVEASPEPAAAPFVEQLARCGTLDAVATLWLAAREDIAQGTKADQAAAWGAAVERLAVIQHCAPSKALGVLLSKRIKILAGEEPDPNGPKGSPSGDVARLSDAHGSGEASANDTTAAQASVRTVLDADEVEARLVSSAAAWAEHLAQHAGDQWALAIGCAKRRVVMTAAGVYADRRKATLDALGRCPAFVDRGHADVFLMGREHPKAKAPGAAEVIQLRNRDARQHLAAQRTGTGG